jgi:hypothetical protein
MGAPDLFDQRDARVVTSETPLWVRKVRTPRRVVRQAPHDVAPLSEPREVAAFVVEAFEEYHNARNSEASRRSEAKRATTSGKESAHLTESAQAHALRATNAVLRVARRIR